MCTPITAESRSVRRWRVVQNAIREHEICAIFRVLRSIDVEPILLKGWSVGRLYPSSQLRGLGDIDLLVGEGEVAHSDKKLREYGQMNVDWHELSSLKAEFAEPDEIMRRSELVPLGDTQVRVLCHEDNLHFVAIHMLRHGGWSPIWIEDVAVLLRSRPGNFDWDLCLGPDPTRAGWVLSALVLAHRLAGADISDTPAKHYKIARWLEHTVLEAQKTSDPADNQPPESIWAALAHPWRLPSGIRKRWPSPLTAAIKTGAPFELRLPVTHQVRYCASLAREFFSRAI